MSDVVAMEREAEGSGSASSAPQVAAGGPEDFAAVMQSVQEASRNAENVTFLDSPIVAGWFLANWQSRRDVSVAWPGE
jgi:hypothetical protein